MFGATNDTMMASALTGTGPSAKPAARVPLSVPDASMTDRCER